MWTSRNRARYDRSKLRYPSDVTDEGWKPIEPLIPLGESGGGKRTAPYDARYQVGKRPARR
jgi:hypothetical protein